MKKPFSKSLSSEKIVYAREEDARDTLIIRSAYPDIKHYYAVFGVKDVNIIQLLFLAITKLIHVNADKLRRKAKYVKSQDFEEISKLLLSMKNQCSSLHITTEENAKQQITIAIDASSSIKVSLNVDANFPQIVLSNFKENDTFLSCIHLFISESVKLLKYMNSRFSFNESSTLKVDQQASSKLTSDSFF